MINRSRLQKTGKCLSPLQELMFRCLIKRDIFYINLFSVQFNFIDKNDLVLEIDAENITRKIMKNGMSRACSTWKYYLYLCFTMKNTVRHQNLMYSSEWNLFQFCVFIDLEHSHEMWVHSVQTCTTSSLKNLVMYQETSDMNA